ncbi:substrate-binding periplasmic protein [Pseudoalteromonas sp. T1lg23B]|uniref:substrate-binding periplasmic protein n=1 Tax=Pseudoalteromonas sp. T1lg23B TaxID=2077097 RepID=UPI003FA37597
MYYRLIFVLLIFFTHYSHSCERTFKVGVGTSWPPYVMYEAERYFGVDIDATKHIFAKAGLCIRFVKLPSSARGITELEKGFIDILPSASYNEQRAKIAYFSAEYRRERMRLFTLSALDEVESLSELFTQGYLFTANPGAYYGEELASILRIEQFKDNYFEVASLSQRMELVRRGRVDFLIEDEASGIYYKNRLGYDTLRVHPYVIHDNGIHFMLNKDAFDIEQVAQINRAISLVSEQLKAIELKYQADLHDSLSQSSHF